MTDFELTMKLRNNQLISRRRAFKKSPREMAELVGITYGLYLRYEGLTKDPRSKRPERDGRWMPSAHKVAEAFGVEPEDLWPDMVLSVVKATVVTEIEGSELAALAGFYQQLDAPKNIEALAVEQEQRLALGEALSELSEREQRLLRQHFFEEKTYQEVAVEDGVSRTHIGNLTDKAVRKLRNQLSGRDEIGMTAEEIKLQRLHDCGFRVPRARRS